MPFQPHQPNPFPTRILADKYEVLAPLGEGGMGIVYQGRHILMDRKVAIKVVHSRLAAVDPHYLERFTFEARACSSLNHPNVVTIFDFGVWQNLAYLVMDYLQGVSLKSLLQRQEYLEPWRAVHIFAQACDALSHAHTRGIIHRDLKPSNIMLVEDEETKAPLVKLVDFGIAKLLPGVGHSMQQMADTGAIFGSPLYMSPEQCMGQKQDGRSDIYSLGCLMYEALCGQPPIRGDNVLSIVYKHINEPAAPFLAVAPRLSIPEELESVVLKALEKSPDDRFQSMQELKKALLRAVPQPKFVDDVSVLDRPILSNEPDASPTTTIGSETVGITGYVPDQVENQYLRLLKADERKFGENSPKLVPTMHILAEHYRKRGQKADAERYYSNAIQILVREHGPWHMRVAHAVYKLATFYQDSRRYADAEPLYQDLLQIKLKHLGKDHPDLCYVYFCLADMYMQQDKYQESEQYYLQALKVAQNVFDDADNHDPVVIPIYLGLVACYMGTGRRNEAMVLTEKVVELKEATFGPDHTDVATSLVALGIIYEMEDKITAAERVFGRALTIFENEYGPSHPEVATALTFLGWLYANRGMDEAETVYKRAIAIRKQALEADAPELVSAYEALAGYYLKRKRYEDAEPLYKTILTIRERQNDDLVAIATSYGALATIFHATEKWDQAERSYQRAIENELRCERPRAQIVLELICSLAEVYVSMSLFAEAEEALIQGLEFAERNPDLSEADAIPLCQNLSEVYKRLGREADAEFYRSRTQAMRTRSN